MFGFGIPDLINVLLVVFVLAVIIITIKLIISYFKNKKKLQSLSVEDEDLDQKANFLKQEIEKISRQK